MGKVFFDIGLSLDGFMAGDNRGPDNPLGDGGLNIHNWMFAQRAFRKHLGMEGGETGTIDNEVVEHIFNRIGSNIMGKRMFEEGEANWPEEAPFGNDVYVLTNEKREPWERNGGTVFIFENDKIEDVLEKAKDSARDKDIRISGGAGTIQQYINKGLIEEFVLHVAPVILGKGLRLFENINKDVFKAEQVKVISSPEVVHLYYKVIK